MNQFCFQKSVFFSLLFALLGWHTALYAHGDELPVGKPTADHFTVYGQSDKYELTLYYPPLTAGQASGMTLYVADYFSNRPIDKAELKITAVESPQSVFEVHLLSPGVYEVRTTFPENKIYTLNIQVVHPNGADLIGMKNIEVGKALPHLETEEHTEGAAPAMPSWAVFLLGLLAGGILVFFVSRKKSRSLTLFFLVLSAWFSMPYKNIAFAHGDEEHGPKSGSGAYGKAVYAPKETQFLFEILTQPMVVGDYHSATTMFGTIVPASGGLGAVIAPQGGRITRVNVAVGQSVRAGQTLAVLQQNIGTSDQVGIAANNSSLAVQTTAATSKVAAAKKELDRLKKIEDLAAGRDIQAAEANYRQALAELQLLDNKSISDNKSANNRTLTLTAPISGVVGAFNLTAGTEVAAGQALFTVTNLNKVYVEAQVYDRDVPVVRAGNKFIVMCSTDDHKTSEVRLISPALSMNPGNQSQRVIFEMDNPRGEFKIGEFVTLKALDGSTSRQITVPNAALTEINGKTAVFVKHAPEEYELIFVQTGEDDGTRTLILKGLEEDEKVVVNGAYEVKMMYFNQ